MARKNQAGSRGQEKKTESRLKRLRRLGGLCLPPVSELRRHRESFLWSLGSVALLALCYPPFNLWPLGFVALIPWLWGLRRTTPRIAFWISWVFGAVHFLTLFYWLHTLSRFNPFIYLGIPVLCLFTGFFYAVNGGGMVFFARRFPPAIALGLAALWWAGWEWFRSVGALGLPYALVAHTVRGFIPLIQVTAVGGMVLLSVLVLLVNLTIMETLASWKLSRLDAGVLFRLGGSLGLVLVAAFLGARTARHVRASEEAGYRVRVAMVQPNVIQDEKFASYAIPGIDRMTQAEQIAAFRRMQELKEKLTLDVFDLLDGIEPGSADLIVTPESVFTQELFDHDEELQRELRIRAKELGAPIILGANDAVFFKRGGGFTDVLSEAEDPTLLWPDDFYGGLFVIRPEDEELKMIADYQKIHLMPFGETVPYFDKIPYLQEKIVQIASFQRGSSRQPNLFVRIDPAPNLPDTETVPVHVGPTICFEDMFPYLHRRLARRGAQVFINITNDAWYDPSLGSAFHFLHVPIRCAETHIPMIRVTNTGISALIDGTGQVLRPIAPLRERGVFIQEFSVPAESPTTPYSRLGDWFGILSFLLACGVWVRKLLAK